MNEGREEKRFYYNCRIELLDFSGLEVLATTLQQAPISGSLDLAQPTLIRKLVEKGSMSRKAAEQFFKDVLHKGVLSNAGTKSALHYDVPILSMKAFLVEKFGS